MAYCRWIAATAPWAVVTLLLSVLIGCASRNALPDIDPGPYQGPPVTLDSSRAEHIAIFHAPMPGWVASVDRVAEQYRYQAVFISLRRPNPAFIYPQVEVQQRIATNVVTSVPVKVYVRTQGYDEHDSYNAYTLAAATDTETAPQP